jgi:tetratricopeptide (TPR) repeat protein
MGARLRNVGEHARALEISGQALAIAIELRDESLVIEATYRLAQAHFAFGELAQAGSLFAEVARTLADDGVARRLGLSPFFAGWAEAWLALVLSHLGGFDEAVAHAEAAMRIAEAADHPHTIVEAHAALGGVHLERGDLPGALRVFERAMALLRARGVVDSNVLSGLGHACVLSGRITEGLDLLEQSLEGEASISARGLGLAVRASRLAEAYLVAGRLAEARERARGALDLARKHEERANEALALRVVADVAAAADAPDASAVADYAAAITLAEPLGMRPLLAHCHRGLGVLYGRADDHPRAMEHLAIAATMYREMGMTSWLERAERAIATGAR